ncbi:RNA 2',3'-cyclic phosphodiesterase [Nocardioides sp. AX2bis]|uniref:RNA 2',3'-cyclic phosphodiesterase n=1 Tax=Nocardioides sp. AX2bis TaxID=2653157 RepID=UPI0012F07C63|nr:RNA 2',3'-cyclic phosphodiesterase [Nocardioides sp. AX2bis]VXC33215.1 RNA 2',3'-cyclic phosphodiesterase [Nocardioides sp. AX2bis]
MRVFAALVPPVAAREDLADFLAPRWEAGRADGLRWSDPEQWHVTLAFAADVDDWRLEEVEERLAAAASRSAPMVGRVTGGGAFPDPVRAKVLWSGPALEGEGPEALERLAVGARTALATAGAEVDGARFRPHLTLARRNRPGRVDDWVRLLDGYRGPVGAYEHLTLVASHLGEGPRGRPRHEVLAELPLGG